MDVILPHVDNPPELLQCTTHAMAPLRVLITGPPGTGKTTLCYKAPRCAVNGGIIEGIVIKSRFAWEHHL